MTQQCRPYVRSLFLSLTALALVVAGCHKKPPAAPPAPAAPPPAAAKPTAQLSADKTSVNKGESVKLSWTTTDAQNVSITPDVGAVTAQGSTSVTPSQSTTYTLTATGPGGSADSTVSVNVNAPPPPREAPAEPFDKVFLDKVKDAFFDYDSAEIRSDARAVLQNDADFLKAYPQARVTIEGHCDERGSTEYNLALGDRRANAVKQYLVTLGVPADRLTTTSYGKEKPFCSESNEACWQQNRRGHFTLNK